MTLAFIAWNLSRRFIARIIFHTVRILQVVLCLSFESLLQSWCYGKISNLTYFGLPGKFSNDVERWAQVLLYFHFKNLHFAENMLFYPKNDVMAFLSDVHVYIKSNAVIWFWRYCHVRTRQTSENQITDRKCVVQTNSRVKWRWFYSGMSEFNCLVVVLFSAMFSCFLLDSFELQEMVCVTKHGATFSSLNISRRYDEHACDTIFFSLCWKLKN